MRYWLPVLLSLTGLGAGSCATTPPPRYLRHALVDQILTVRPGVKGLSNRACEEWGEENACKRFGTVAYDLEDAGFRKAVNDFGFVCNVGGKRFKVCLDKPGFCRITYVKSGFLKLWRKKVEDAYIPQENELYLTQARTRCAAKDRYPFINSWGAVPFGGLSQ